MRWVILGLVIDLAGCANGTILGPDHPKEPGASYISVRLSDQEAVFLKSLHSQDDKFVRLKQPGMWVSAGWFMVEYHCDSPKDRPQMMITDEDGEDESIHIYPNRWYTVACDDKAPFVFHFVDQGDVANQR